jgi:hypothetical protein
MKVEAMRKVLELPRLSRSERDRRSSLIRFSQQEALWALVVDLSVG